MNVSNEGLQLILDYEVGGGQAYYDKFLKHPTWPGVSSGVTIGIGFDLGYVTEPQFTEAWCHLLRPDDFSRLVRCCGKKGVEVAKPLIKAVQDISVGWEQALEVFKDYTLPVHWMRTTRVYPQASTIHPHCGGALLSLCFNRGTDIAGERRSEMREIQSHLRNGELSSIPQLFRDMKRLWPETKGLRLRRDAEADLFQKGLNAKA